MNHIQNTPLCMAKKYPAEKINVEKYQHIPVPEFTTKFSKVSSMATVPYPESTAIAQQTVIRRNQLIQEMQDIPSAPPSTESGDIICEHGICVRKHGNNFGLVDMDCSHGMCVRHEKHYKNPNKFVYQRSTMYTSIDEM